MIKTLSLCAALFAPGPNSDPHGRSMHLKADVEFNKAYTACITTVKQASRYRIDPFVMLAATYRTTKMSLKTATRRKAQKRILSLYGCEGTEEYVRGTCSPFIVGSQHFAKLLNETIEQSSRQRFRRPDYRKALCRFLSSNGRCTKRSLKEAKIIENMAGRFVDMYARTHTGFAWRSPFAPKATEEELLDEQYRQEERELRQWDRRAPYRRYPRSGDPALDDLIRALRAPSPTSGRRISTELSARHMLEILSSIVGPAIKVQAKMVGENNPIFLVHADQTTLRQILWATNTQTSVSHNNYYPKGLVERGNGVFNLRLASGRRTLNLTFSPDGRAYRVEMR